MQPITAKPKHGRQFSLRALMVLVTIVCLILGLPRGYILLAAISFWLILGAAILLMLTALQQPIYRILSGVKRVEKKDG